jgi:signal transduction histidine kinase
VFSLLVWVDAAPWRFALAGTVFSLLLVLSRRAPRSWRRDRLTAHQITAAAWTSGLGQLGIVFVLGGLAGPLLPVLPLTAVIMNLIAPGRIALFFVLCVQVPAVWLFAWLQMTGAVPDLVPNAWHGLFVPSGTPGTGPLFGASFMTLVLIGGVMMGRILRGILLDLLREQVAEREVQLEIHAESARTLSRLSAEIAHELKNPLASIKGLSALVSKDLEGKKAERMDVLRREVERMQAILEEFLNYSRPLVPLDEERVDLVRLARDVVALHEAMAMQHEVQLDSPPDLEPAVNLRCDPRKVRQIVINLVQNAIEATAKGGSVRVSVDRDESGAVIRVIDEGEGLRAEAAHKLFQVGYTTKERGHGIGLAVARGLAHQHGGELSLESRDTGGCVATLRLPTIPKIERANEVVA